MSGQTTAYYTRTGAWVSTNTGDQVQLWLCSACGSVVHDKDKHDEWHRPGSGEKL